MKRRTFQEMSVDLEKHGFKLAPPDHPSYREGPSITFVTKTNPKPPVPAPVKQGGK